MITVLFLAANPTDTARLRLDEESRAVGEALQKTEFREHFVLEKHFAVRASDLSGLLLHYKPDILHFSGHGLAENAIVLEDDAGHAQMMPAQLLSQLLATAGRNVRCAVLNACYSHAQASALVEQVGCVVGLPSEVGDRGAIAFAAAFYQALGYGQDIRTAFELGRFQATLSGVAETEQPCLKARDDSAAAVRFIPESVDTPQAAAVSQRTGISTTVLGGDVGKIVNVNTLHGGLTIGET